MRILVTGGAGFIGSNIVDAYINLGYEVAIADNLSTGLKRNINSKAKFYEVDLTNINDVNYMIADFAPDLINHHAAQVDVRISTSKPHMDATINIIGSLNLIDAAAQNGVGKIIYASTGGAVYGEPIYLPVNEHHPVNPLSQYGISKHTVEHYLYLYNYNFGLDYTVLRYPNVYGPRQNPHGEAGVIAIFANKIIDNIRPTIYGEGNQTRDYLFVSDVVHANVLSLTKGSREILNLGTGVSTSVLGLLEHLNQISRVGVEPIFAEPRVGEIQAISLDALKAKEVLGWEPRVNLRSGLEQTYEWISNEGRVLI